MHYGHPFLDQSGRKWHNKRESRQREGGKLSHGGQKRRTWETGSKRERSELEETPAGVVVLVWTELSGRGNGSGARVRAQKHDWCDTQKDRV